jgi:predicted RNA-binding Zn-ribbon protein involved in translation (DUF1610 family)
MESDNNIKVYHLTGRTPEGRSYFGEITFSKDIISDAKQHWKNGHYRLVAGIHADSEGLGGDDDCIKWLEIAYERTNTIDSYWWENPSVTPYFKDHSVGCRSTSTGDIVKLPDGRKFVCASVGWEEMVEFRERETVELPESIRCPQCGVAPVMVMEEPNADGDHVVCSCGWTGNRLDITVWIFGTLDNE